MECKKTKILKYPVVIKVDSHGDICKAVDYLLSHGYTRPTLWGKYPSSSYNYIYGATNGTIYGDDQRADGFVELEFNMEGRTLLDIERDMWSEQKDYIDAVDKLLQERIGVVSESLHMKLNAVHETLDRKINQISQPVAEPVKKYDCNYAPGTVIKFVNDEAVPLLVLEDGKWCWLGYGENIGDQFQYDGYSTKGADINEVLPLLGKVACTYTMEDILWMAMVTPPRKLDFWRECRDED